LIHYEDIRDVTSPLGIKNLNDTLRRLWDKVANIDTKDITDGSITTIKLIDKVITSEKIDEATITTAHIKDANITEAKIEDASITTAKIKAANITNALIEDATITGAKIKDAEIGSAHIKDGSIDNLKIDRGSANKLVIVDADISNASISGAKIRDATIDTAQIALGAIKTALIDTEAVGTAQIANGSITDAKIVELTANKITAGQLSVERLIIRATDDPTKSLVYQINNIDGALQSIQGETLNGEILTERSITADKIVANAITANEIASKTITANEIVSNTITAASGIIADIDASTIKTGKLTGIVVESENYVQGVSGSKYDLSGGSIDTKNFKVDSNGDVLMADAIIEGEFEQYDKGTNLPSVSIKKNAMQLYDWKDTGASIGGVSSTFNSADNSKGATLYAENGYNANISVKHDDTANMYVKISARKDFVKFYTKLDMSNQVINNVFSITDLSSIKFTVATNDYARIQTLSLGENDGMLEIATADDGNEPIVVRQYTGVFGTIKNSLVLLNANGHTELPNDLYVDKKMYQGNYRVLDARNVTHSTISLTTDWKTFYFNLTLGGLPTVVITPMSSNSGVIAGKTRNVTSTGFEACIGGTGTPLTNFSYIAFTWL